MDLMFIVKAEVKNGITKMIKNLDNLISQIYPDFNIYKFLGRLSKSKIILPEEVIISICNSYLKNKVGIKNKWAWFIKTAQECWKNHNAQKNIVDSKELNNLSQSKEIRELVKGIK